jgi:outer membrane protein OmpA-like peptidoglycan-associated protein
MYVDPLEMSLSEVQSAIIAPVEAGFVTRTLTTPTLGLAPAPPDRTELPDGSEGSEPARPRRRRRVIAPLLVAVLAVGGAGAWWQLRPGTDQQAGSHTAASVASVSDTAPPAPDPRSTATTAGQDAASQTPVVTHAKPSQTPDRKPNVTLKSDLAFGFDSATLSPQARSAVEHVARQVRDNGLTGKIYVDGYTDDLGSQAHGLVLSQRRADAVAHYLGSQLVGVPVTIVSTGHGESRPIADNATSQGRQANRRVTITLPVS